MKKIAVQLLFLILVLGGGFAIGSVSRPDEWYAALAKPTFNPPNWVFAPVWSFIYVLIAYAGSRTWSCDRFGVPMKLWWGQMLLNFLWSPAFFIAHRIDISLLIIVLLLLGIIAFIWKVRAQDKISAMLFAPYLAWVSFASVLNASIFILN